MYKDIPDVLNNDGHCSLCHCSLEEGDSPWSICFDPCWQHNSWGGDSHECRAVLCQECAEKLLMPNDDSDEEEVPDWLPLPLQPPKTRMYASAVQALCTGTHHRAILLKEGYHFEELHTRDDIQPYEFSGPGYPSGGVPVAFTRVNESTMGIDEIQFDRITGEFFGCIVLNECGLIAYMPLLAHVNDSTVTIIAAGGV